MATGLYSLVPANPIWQAGAYALVAGGCVGAVVWSVRRYRPRLLSTWYAFVAGLTIWLVDSVIDRVTESPAWGTVSDLLDVAGYPLVCWALAGLIRGRARAQDRTAIIDGGLVATSLGLLYWIFVVGGAVADPGVGWAQKVLTVLVAIGDITLFVLGSLLVTTPGARTVSYRLMLGALLLTAVSDILVVVDTNGRGPADVVSLLANTLVAAAALHPSMRRLTVPLARPPDFVRPRLALLTATVLLAPTVGLYQGATGRAGDSWLATGIGTIILFVLVAVRMMGLVGRVEAQSQTLARLAWHDALTGLANRRQWDERLPETLAECAATGEPLFAALLDLDRFKTYNDTYGHQAGDELLADAAAAWQGLVREGDLLARYGGEEFAVLLIGCTEAEATLVLERLLAATPHAQTFSAGLARWDGQESPEALLHRADQLMYASKRTGRSRITDDRVPAQPRTSNS